LFAQDTPQPPQFDGSVLVFTSQPLAGFLSQSAKPGLQVATVHKPLAQPAVPLAMEQTCPQLPQFFGSEATLISQPLLTSPSQFAKPGLHEAIVQVPLEQDPVALAGEHVTPHAPQFVAVFRVTHVPLQQPWPFWH